MRPPEARPACDARQPWAPSAMPALRSGPPYIMAEAIASEPAVVERLLTDPGVAAQARAVASLLRSGTSAYDGWPPTVTGCGSSEHAAIAAAAIWKDAWRRAGLPGPGPVARQAFEAARDPWPGVTIAISHEGGSSATADALRAARIAGARTGLITAGANSPCAELSEATVCTRDLDPSWCHTIAYVAPIAVAAVVASELGDDPDRDLSGASRSTNRAARLLVESGIELEDQARDLAHALASSRMVTVAASGTDIAAGRELALKIEEAAYVPAPYRDLEALLHGHVAALDVGSGLVLVLTDRDGRAARVARARQLLGAVGRVGARCAAVLSAGAAEAIP